MSNDRIETTALVPVKKEIKVGDQTPSELVRGLMVSMSQSGENWKDIFAPESKGMLDLATGVRLANALNLDDKTVFMDKLKRLIRIDDEKGKGDLAFDVITTLLTSVFDREDGNRWRLPEMDENLRKWCVEVIRSKLKGLVDADDLMTINDIMTRSDANLTVFGYVETYLTGKDVSVINETISEEQRKLIDEGQVIRFKQIGGALGRTES